MTLHPALLAALLGGMALSCDPRAAKSVAPRHLFGPVVENEVIAGRAEEFDDRSPVLLLVGERTLVEIDVEHRSVVRRGVPMPGVGGCWGLARLRDGSLWTLKGRNVLAQLAPDGRILKEAPLGAAHFGIFGNGDRLIYQPADFTPPGQAFFVASPDNDRREAWSTIRTRPFQLARASVAALNLVSCGIGRGAERPCWFPDEAAIALVDPSGATRRVALPGLEVVAPEVLLTSDNPARPIRDVYIDDGGTVWVLSSGKPASAAAADVPGGWLIARYDTSGRPIDTSVLSEPARLILRADSRRALVLTGSGMVAEIVP